MTSPTPTTPSSSPRALRPHKELLIAWALLQLRFGEAHGYRLYQKLIARGLDLQSTRLYRWLRKFERDGWVASRWRDSAEGPERRVYVLTEEGRSALRAVTGLIAAVRDTYSAFLDAHAQAVARRDGDIADGDEDATDVVRESSATSPQVPARLPAGTQALRPHKELLVGWLLLHLEAGATYGYDLRRQFAAHRLIPDAGIVYRMLRKLEDDKWVQSRWMAPAAGPRRRFYRLTARGRRHLDEIAPLIATIRDSHDAYLREFEQAPRLPATKGRARETPEAA